MGWGSLVTCCLHDSPQTPPYPLLPFPLGGPLTAASGAGSEGPDTQGPDTLRGYSSLARGSDSDASDSRALQPPGRPTRTCLDGLPSLLGSSSPGPSRHGTVMLMDPTVKPRCSWIQLSGHQRRAISASFISARLQRRGVHKSGSMLVMRRMTWWCERSQRTHHSQSRWFVHRGLRNQEVSEEEPAAKQSHSETQPEDLYSKKCRERKAQSSTAGSGESDS